MKLLVMSRELITRMLVGFLFFGIGMVFMLVYSVARVLWLVGAEVDWLQALKQGLIVGTIFFAVAMISQFVSKKPE